MYRTKKEVDKHVSDILSKVQNENERNIKGFPIAKLYYQVKDYEMSKRYLAGYLSVKETHAPAHKLMGQIMEAVGNQESALQSYKRSLDIDSYQKDLVLKVCELYCQQTVDPDTARYWADRAEKLFGHHEVIFHLRECIVNAEGEPNIRDLEQLITSELNSRPKDVSLYTKLLKLYTDTERVEEAYRYAANVETKKPFPYSIDWYYCLADIFEAYQEESSQLQLQFCLEYFLVLDHLCTLLLAEPHALSASDTTPTKHGRSVADAASVLHTLDKFLHRASLQSPLSQDQSWNYLKQQMQGQLYLHLGTLLLKRTKKERANWKEACRYASALYLVAYTFKPGSLQQEAWFCKMEDNKQMFLDVHQKGFLRLSYAGHVLWSMCTNREERPRWLQKVKQETCVPQAQDKIFQRAFSSIPAPLQHPSLASSRQGLSFFLQDAAFIKASLEFPTESSLHEYDRVSHKVYPDSLHHLVWLSLHWLPTKQFTKQPKFQIFEKLQMSNALLNGGSPESLCQLDADAFLCATIFSAWKALEVRDRIKTPTKGHSSQAQVLSVTPDICDPLCTPEQAAWWRAAYALYFNEAREKLGEMRQTLRRGLETIRGVGAHGMEIALVVHLARHFASRADNLRQTLGEDSPSEEASILVDRATHYWNLALLALDKLQSGNGNLSSTPRSSPAAQRATPLFPSFHGSPSVQEVVALMDEAKYYLATQLMNSGQLAEAAQAFARLTSAEAAHNQATVLVKLSQQSDQDRDTSYALLSRARDALYTTLDRLAADKRHPLNLQLHEEIEAVELKLAHSHNNGLNPEEASEESSPEDEEQTSNINNSLNGGSPRRPNSMNNNLRDLLNMGTPTGSLNRALFDSSISSSTSRPRLRPSPERLDAQIRALSYNHMGVVQLLVEQQRSLMETNRSIVEELKQNKSLVEDLKKQIEELQGPKCNHNTPQSGHSQAVAPRSSQRPLVHHPRSIRTSQQDDDNEEYEDGAHPELGHPYDYTLDPEESGFDYGSYLQDPRNQYPMMMQYPYAQHPHLANTIPSPLPPQTLMGARAPPPPRPYYPPYGTSLTFSDGQQLPQFNFRMPPPTVPVPGMPPMDNRNTVFTRLGMNNGTLVQPQPSPWENQPMQPSASLGMPQDLQWNHNKGSAAAAAAAPHAFQIPLPQSHLNSGQPPSILSTGAEASFGSPQAAPGVEMLKGTTPFGTNKPVLEPFQGFSTPGNVSVGSPVTPSSARKDQSNTDEDEFEFEPAIPLPDEVDVCTGEEHESLLFQERAKLFRFVDKEWKERGVGVLKILLDKGTEKIRLLMRRDQVLKVCANHHILSTMQLQPMKDSDRAWTWYAQDFAEEALRNEQFCIRFKNKDLALAFKVAFESAARKDAERIKTPVKPQDNAATVPKSFGDAFKPASGTWACLTCCVMNTADVTQCVCCETPKPGSENLAKPTSGFCFGGPPVSGGGFAALFSGQSVKCGKCKSSVVNTEGELCLGCKNESTNGNDKLKTETFGAVSGINEAKTTGVETEPKSVFGGFTFITPPVIKPGIDAAKDSSKTAQASGKQDRLTATPAGKQNFNLSSEKPASSPFASFHFPSKPASGDLKISFVSSTPLTTKDTEPTVLFGENSKSNDLTFESIAGTPQTAGFRADPNFRGFPGSGKKLFDVDDPTSPKDTSKDVADDFVPSAEFQPVVPLPKLVELKTGEEDEEKMFSERAKLFRYAYETKEWKERGIGEIKILKNVKTHYYRVLMRRDQVLKICANHRINPEMKLTPMATSDKAWIWFAQDYSEGEMKDQQFAVKFKNKEIASKFKSVFEECQVTTVCEKSPAQPSPPKVADTTVPLSQAFKPKPGSWECPGCYSQQDSKADVCPSCNTARPGSKPVAKPTVAKSLSEMFKREEGSWNCSSCYVQNKAVADSCVSCSTPNPKAQTEPKAALPNFSFIAAAAATKPTETKSPFSFGKALPGADSSTGSPFKATGFTFGNQTDNTTPFGAFKTSFASAKQDGTTETTSSPFTSTFKFGSFTAPDNKNSTPLPGHVTPPPVGEGFKFGSPQKFEFCFSGVRPRSPSKTPKSPGDSTQDGTEDEADASENDSFQPVIPLPPKVDAKTGEEGEEVLYCHRAKLFRLDQGEWKERGTGDVKILRDTQTAKIRLLMRREQVLKVCMNHLIPVDLELKEKGEKTWLWSAVDYSEGSPQPQQLALRFKNHEVALEFKEAVENAKTLLKNQDSSVPKLSDVKTSLFEETPPPRFEKSSPLAGLESAVSPGSVIASPSFGLPQKTSPTATSGPFVFGNAAIQQHNLGNSSATGGFIFGGTLRNDTAPASPVVHEMSTTDVQVLEEKISTEEQQNLAQSLQLPSNFYRYEDKEPCTGCRGCDEADVNKEDVEITFVKQPTEEQKERARRLLLPDSFFLYEDKPPCPGCRGCCEDGESPKKVIPSSISPVKSDATTAVTRDSATPSTTPKPRDVENSMTTGFGSVSFNASDSFTSGTIPEFSFAKLAAATPGNGFAELAAQNAQTPFKNTGGATGFMGAGQPVFARLNAFGSPKENGEDSEEVAPSVDTHFDPLVPLPELVEVKTGEEEEQPIFSQRARLYRFDADAKQWKERGVGEMKILKHSSKCQFRLVLRREQVLKTACNHLITSSLDLKPMANSTNSLMWFTMDFAEGIESAETFSIKFKSRDLLQEFQQKVEACKAAITSQENEVVRGCETTSPVKTIYQGEPSDQENEEAYEEEEEYEEGTPEWAEGEVQGDEDLYYKATEAYEGLRRGQDLVEEGQCIPDVEALIGEGSQEDLYNSEEVDEEEDDEDDDDEQLMFEKRISLAEAPLGSKDYKVLGVGTLRVLYDDTVYGGRIQVTDDSCKLLCDHIVAVQTCLRVMDKEATWAVVDIALPETTRRQFKAIFSSRDAAQEFQSVFDEAKQLAVNAEIVENEGPTPNF